MSARGRWQAPHPTQRGTGAHARQQRANLYREQGKYDLAEPLYQQAMRICPEQLNDLHPDQVALRSDSAQSWEAQRSGDHIQLKHSPR